MDRRLNDWVVQKPELFRLSIWTTGQPRDVAEHERKKASVASSSDGVVEYRDRKHNSDCISLPRGPGNPARTSSVGLTQGVKDDMQMIPPHDSADSSTDQSFGDYALPPGGLFFATKTVRNSYA
jgi:hypothetical protein